MTLEVKDRIRPHHLRVAPPRVGLVQRMFAVIATIQANRQLARAARRYKSRGSPPIPPYLRHDLGLPPESEQIGHWDYR